MLRLFYLFPQNFLKAFSGYNIFFHIAAIVLTYMIVTSGLDWTYFIATQNQWLKAALFPAIVIGGLIPIVFPLILYFIGKIKRSDKTIIVAMAVGQAAILGSIVSSAYKTLTGRVEPNLNNTVIDVSHSFHFGFWEHGIFWGWPSSHTTIAFAVSMTIFIIYKKNPLVRYFALIYAFYIGIGISTSIHWFSDFIAGMLIGTAIGLVVGKSYRELLDKSNPI